MEFVVMGYVVLILTACAFEAVKALEVVVK